MPDRPGVAVDLKVIATLIRLVSIEVNGRVFHAISEVLVSLNVAQAVRLVPAGRENVEGDLATDRVGEADVGEGLLELGDHGCADVVRFVVRLILVALVGGGITTDRGDVDHAVAELDEGAALDGDVKVGDVVEDPAVGVLAAHRSFRVGTWCGGRNAPLDKPLIFLLADPTNEARTRERLAQSICRKAVLGEAEVEEGGDVDVAAELLLLLDEVGAANEADGNRVPELREQLQHLRLR
jgi:hypothetical protein